MSYKIIFSILLILFLLFIPLGLCDEIELPYTETANISQINYLNDTNNNISLLHDNSLYSMENNYIFGYGGIIEGDYTHTTIFNDNLKIIEFFDIEDAFLHKKVNYTISIYNNDVLIDSIYFKYIVYETSGNTNTKSLFIFNENEISYNMRYTDGLSYKEYNSIFITQKNNLINHINSISDYEDLSVCLQQITYITEGNKPKSYYIEKLNPLLRTPYKFLLDNYDDDNNLLNFFLLISYILSGVFFWIKIIYSSLFAIYIIIILGLIPLISYVNSVRRIDFIYELVNNYKRFGEIHIKLINWFIITMIRIIGLIPFI